MQQRLTMHQKEQFSALSENEGLPEVDVSLGVRAGGSDAANFWATWETTSDLCSVEDLREFGGR